MTAPSRLTAIGSYTAATGGRGVGVTLVRRNDDDLIIVDAVAADSPSFLAWAPDGSHLYAVEETDEGALIDYELRGERLVRVAGIPLGSARPCHVAVHPSGRLLVASCYGGGEYISVLIGADGAISGEGTRIRHTERGPHPTRQSQSHPHAVTFTPDGSAAVLMDLGADTVSVHRVAGADVAASPASVGRCRPGAGPRHAAWLDDVTLAVVEELSATASVWRVEAATLEWTGVRVATSLAADPDAWPSEVAVRFGDLFVANRAPSTLSVLAVTGAERGVRRELQLPAGNVRHFACDEDGALWLALQDADRVVIADGSGRERARIPVGSPACIVHAPRARE